MRVKRWNLRNILEGENKGKKVSKWRFSISQTIMLFTGLLR